MSRMVMITTVVLLSCLAGPAAAQQLERNPKAPAETLLVGVGGKIGNKKYQASGNGTCRHTPDASIEGVSASVWTVQFDGSGRDGLERVNLKLRRPKDGSAEQLTLALETRKSGSHRIETGGDENVGEGTVVILPNGPGGRFEINGKDARGKRIQITIDCPAFTPAEEEG
jgi:hypothetical protein